MSAKPHVLVLSLGGATTMLPGALGGNAPRMGVADLLAALPILAELAEVEVRSMSRLPSPSLDLAMLVGVAQRIEDAFANGCVGAVVLQGSDTIEESAFILDVLVAGERPVVVTGAMRTAEAPGADGPANLFAAVLVAISAQARGLGTLVVMNNDIHAARFVQKQHTALPSAFWSPTVGPIGLVAEGVPRLLARVPRLPCLPSFGGPLRPVALIRWGMGEDGRLLGALPGLGYAGAVIEGMGAGHVPAEAAPLLGELAARMPVILASRCASGPVFTSTYGYAGGEIDLLRRGLVPAGCLSGLKARLLLAIALRAGSAQSCASAVFAPYQ